MNTVEETVNAAVQWLRLGIETTGVLIIAMGVVVAAFGFLRALIAKQGANFNPIRLQLARYLALGLEFQLGADILSTAIAPSWDEIGKLAAIAVIRTGLNYFLMQEMRHERALENENETVTENPREKTMPLKSLLFDNWADVGRTALIGVLAYAALVLLLRVSGKRTLSKMNAFDFIVTVALGSVLATILLSKDVALADGVTAMATLIALQFIVAWLSVRFQWVSKLVKAEPALLLHRGEFCRDAMRRERVVESEIRAAVRGQGINALEKVESVILETDGSFSVIEITN